MIGNDGQTVVLGPAESDGKEETPSVAKAGWPPVPRAVARPDDVLTALRRVAIGAVKAATDELQYLGGTLVLL